ncbi:MAG: TetR/AcrR family transcriptional regulator [Proteobacteria bacterium]|nr:TetR/AcrR family transcriptional regulator [Pseudomonadota bacterium]
MSPKSSFKQLREEERETRRQLIMEASLKLFDKKPFHEIGMRDIAEAAGISPASIYRYFPTRDELFAEVLTQDLAEIEPRIQKRLAEGKGNYETLIGGIIEYVMENAPKFQMMCHCMLAEGMNDKVIKGYRAIEQYILHLFEDAFREAGFTDNVPMRVQAALCSLIGIIMVFKNYPDLTENEKKSHMFNVAMAFRYPEGKSRE